MAGLDPYAGLPPVASFAVRSASFKDGETLPRDQRSGLFGAGGKDISPQLSWSGAPQGTRSFAVTLLDPDAPGAGSFWHWAVLNLPADTAELPAGAGSRDGSLLPAGAFQLKNDGGFPGYLGAAAPPGHGPHRYIVAIHALDVEDLGLDARAAHAKLASALVRHTLGRAIITGMFER
ncbi:YbhB/YbcL family Raf kinase inhibitor-like protein [Arthrobacter sp. CJ23]|uniref:YbhB/YbcL family Raf kinase inhibitor-like protein n=1 Tax=Arthrobacter sp. CJ23 TaxID=2972479 RepID=UPI00215B990C|nr:YbhB/YbcL family Raf kinase inhibitor-like protein [Arthrobacter sp. CJ23]UVJ39678.1 YbhB/YbcL family Raf kinase inhibitor-like protein [Arthrobacter sp. CJ23]